MRRKQVAEKTSILPEHLEELSDEELDQIMLILYETRGEEQRIVLSDLHIVDKTGKLVPFEPNDVQKKYLELILPGWERKPWKLGDLRGIRDDILKFRQPGFSTLIEALIFLNITNKANQRAVIAADDEDRAKYLMEKMYVFSEHLPPGKKLRRRLANRNEIYFENGSSVIVGTVGDKNLGIGLTIHHLHCSEIANWSNKCSNPKEVFLTALQAVPMNGNCWKETTANGLNEYYEEYQQEKLGRHTFRPLFFGWNAHSEYQLETPPDFQMSEEEKHLAETYQLTPQQVYWRRKKKGEMGVLFERHYPLNDIECFQTASSACCFNQVYLGRLLQELTHQPPPVRIIQPGERGYVGNIQIYKEPQPALHYAIFADSAEGISYSGKSDHSVFDVFCLENWEQVAHYVSPTASPHEFARDIDAFAAYYNGAEVVVERNNTGHAVLEALIHSFGNPHIYFHEDEKPGFPTNIKTKTLAIDKLQELIDDAALGETSIIIRAQHSVEQLMNFVRKPGGGFGGEGTSKDDAVTCLWIAAYHLTENAFLHKKKEIYVRRDEYVPKEVYPVQWTTKSTRFSSITSSFSPMSRRR